MKWRSCRLGLAAMSPGSTIAAGLLWSAVGASAAPRPKMALTPPLGFNTWNKFSCSGISAQVLMDTADQFVKLGLDKIGFEYVNSDDCWMEATRGDGGRGPQIPNPQKFPHGMRPVADYIHSKGLKLGLYTARANQTCGKYAASCEHERVDIEQWANWTVDYMKDDSCGTCRTGGPHGPVVADYAAMQQAIIDVGRPIVLTIEGGPDITVVYTGCCGNARRVGHDISANWLSMTSLIDIGSGLWPYAHNGSLGTAGGFWNDLDMLEIGNGEFNADTSDLYEAQAKSHYSMWAIMKAVMLLGNDLTQVGPKTLAVIKNTDVLSVNQDPWGQQARRVASTPARNQTLAGPTHAVGLMTRCDRTDPLQAWRLKAGSPDAATSTLNIAPCNVSDSAQRFSLAGGALRSELTGKCADADGAPPGNQFVSKLQACVAGKASQCAVLDNATGHLHVGGSGRCLDCFNNEGPNVFDGGCKPPGDGDDNQRFFPYVKGGASGMLQSGLSGKFGVDTCLTVRSPQLGSALYTVDAGGQAWCLGVDGPQSAFTATTCDPTAAGFAVPSTKYGWTPVPKGGGGGGGGGGNRTYQLVSDVRSYNGRGIALGYGNEFGESGPVPHSRWVQSGGNTFWLDPDAPAGTPVQSTDETGIIDDDNAGHVTKGGAFCLALDPASALEVWAGLLSGTRWAVALFNRSPSADAITVDFAKQLPGLGADGVKNFAVFDAWTKERHPPAPSFTATVEGHGVALLIVTPSD